MISKGSRLDRRWLIGCLVVAAALRLFRIGHQNLWIDEMISLQLATWADGPEFWRGLLRDIHGPLTSVMLRGWMAVGTSEAWIRLLYAIPAVATVPLVYRLAQDLFDERTGRIACLLTAISPFHIWYSQEARNYSWAILWVTGALVLFLRVWDGRGAPKSWVGLATLLVLGVLTNFSVVFLLVALTGIVLLRRPFSSVFAGAWGLTLVTVAVVFIPWFADWFSRIGAERIFLNAPSPVGMPLREASGFSLAGFPYVVWTFAFGYTLGPSMQELHLDRSISLVARHLPILLLGFAALLYPAVRGCGATWVHGRARFVVPVILIPLALAVLLAVREIKTFHPRYLVVFFPMFLAVLAAGWARAGWLSRVTAAAAVALAGLSLGQHYFDAAYGKEDSRAAARYIVEHEAPGDSVVVIYAFRPFRYYFADTGDGKARLLHTHKRFLRSDEEMRRHVAQAKQGSERVWLVLSRWWDVAPEERIRAVFEETLHETGEWQFPGVKVLLYERRPT
jgi:uncharacterized membrane protein